MRGAEAKGEKKYRNDGVVVLGLNGVSVRPLISVVPAARQGLTVRTELAYFPCEPEKEVLVDI